MIGSKAVAKLKQKGHEALAAARAPDRRELVREGAEDGQEPRRRDGGSTGGWKCHNGYVSREPNDIRDDDKGYARLISEWSASIGLNANLQCSLTSTDQSYPNLTAHRQGSRFASRFDMIVP